MVDLENLSDEELAALQEEFQQLRGRSAGSGGGWSEGRARMQAGWARRAEMPRLRGGLSEAPQRL
jgi:hypothetical protein